MIKKRIWEKLDKDGYITDSELAKIYGKEPNWYTAIEYKRQWRKFNFDKEYFDGKKIIEKKHYRNRYLVRTEGMDDDQYIRVGKDYYLSLNDNFIN